MLTWASGEGWRGGGPIDFIADQRESYISCLCVKKSFRLVHVFCYIATFKRIIIAMLSIFFFYTILYLFFLYYLKNFLSKYLSFPFSLPHFFSFYLFVCLYIILSLNISKFIALLTKLPWLLCFIDISLSLSQIQTLFPSLLPTFHRPPLPKI